MTLLSLLIVMAVERITIKSPQWHIATWCEKYFKHIVRKNELSVISNYHLLQILLIAGAPALAIWAVVYTIPLLFEFIISLIVLWVCLGCPVTRTTYRNYLQAANRQDFQACTLHSMKFGTCEGKLDHVGQQLVLVNYRQYASVLIFFIATGLPGLVFYSIVKELNMQQKRMDQQTTAKTEIDKLLYILDWIPVRITAFGFMIVGHFSNALAAWLKILTDLHIGTYEALGRVAKAAEDVSATNSVIDEPLQLVKLAKRNVVFLLMLTAIGTMSGVLY